MPPKEDFWLCTICIRNVTQPGRVSVDENCVGEGRNSDEHKNGESDRARRSERERERQRVRASIINVARI